MTDQMMQMQAQMFQGQLQMQTKHAKPLSEVNGQQQQQPAQVKS